MRKRRQRSLDEADLEVWKQVTRTLRPMRPDVVPTTVPDPEALPKKPLPPVPEPRQPFRLGTQAKPQTATHDLVPPLSDRLAAQPLRMDARTFGKMKRGKISPDSRIDLHGMTLAQAHPALIRFILNAQSHGHRMVIVITGKGRDRRDDGPIPAPRGLLRHNVPLWLSRPPLAACVLQVTDAHHRHGGSGALYVYLRKGR